MDAYRIVDWNNNFEKAQTRKNEGPLKWVGIPTKHDGKGFRRIMSREDGPQIFAAWVLIVQVAAKCPQRGLLIDSDGPLTAEDLAFKTGCPETLLATALSVLCSEKIGWIVVEAESESGSEVVGEGVKTIPTVQDSTLHNSTEHKDSLSVQPDESEFLESWNAAPGVVRNRGSTLSDKRRKSLKVRIRDPSWDWKAALAKFPLLCFEDDPDGWRPDMDWFLKPDSVQKVLEGKYDWRKSSGNSKPKSASERTAEAAQEYLADQS